MQRRILHRRQLSICDKICSLPSYCDGFGLGRVCPTDKIIHQKLRGAKVMCRKQFPIGGGVWEGDLVLAQVGAVHEVVPAVAGGRRKKRKSEVWATASVLLNRSTQGGCWWWCCCCCLPEAFQHAWGDALASHHAHHPDAADAADGRLRRGGAAPGPLPLKHHLLPLRALRHRLLNHPVTLERVRTSVMWVRKWKHICDGNTWVSSSRKTGGVWCLTSWMCSAIRQPPTFLSLEIKRNVLVLEGHFVSTCWKPRSLSTTSLISSTWVHRARKSQRSRLFRNLYWITKISIFVSKIFLIFVYKYSIFSHGFKTRIWMFDNFYAP